VVPRYVYEAGRGLCRTRIRGRSRRCGDLVPRRTSRPWASGLLAWQEKGRPTPQRARASALDGPYHNDLARMDDRLHLAPGFKLANEAFLARLTATEDPEPALLELGVNVRAAAACCSNDEDHEGGELPHGPIRSLGHRAPALCGRRSPFSRRPGLAATGPLPRGLSLYGWCASRA
jgi:hypothetical protein